MIFRLKPGLSCGTGYDGSRRRLLQIEVSASLGL